MRADAGVVISASHNPYQDNGIKIFAADGFKLPDEVEADIERRMEAIARRHDGARRRRPTHRQGGPHRRRRAAATCSSSRTPSPRSARSTACKVVVDCANGAAYQVAPQVFEELGAEVDRAGGRARRPQHQRRLRRAAPRERWPPRSGAPGARIGIALDGDADRVILADEHGKIVDGDQIMAILGTRMLEQRHAARRDGGGDGDVQPRPRAGAGAPRAASCCARRSAIATSSRRCASAGSRFGGEQSGHIVFLDHATTGDGMVAALRVLAVMVQEGRAAVGAGARDDPLPAGAAQLRGRAQAALRGDAGGAGGDRAASRATLGADGRVVVRYSGTESKARVMIEGTDEAGIRAHADEIAECMRSASS